MTDPFAEFKQVQRTAWATFAPIEAFTMVPAAQLVRFGGVARGAEVLDVACGTGVVAVTAARAGGRVRGLDLSPALLEHARANAELAGCAIDFTEGDVEALPFDDATFDVVVSQFGHIFAPRPEVATREMLRVLRPGGRIAFSTWPPQHLLGQLFGLVARHLPPPPGAPPAQWGDPGVVRQRLDGLVVDLEFASGIAVVPALSAAHYRSLLEGTAFSVSRLIASVADDPGRLAAVRAEIEALVAAYHVDNAVRQEFLMTRARKR